MPVNFLSRSWCAIVITASESKRTKKKVPTDLQWPLRTYMYIQDIPVHSYTLKILLIHAKKLHVARWQTSPKLLLDNIITLWARDFHLTNRFYVAVRLLSDRSQMTSKCGKNKRVERKAIAECVTHVFTTHKTFNVNILFHFKMWSFHLSVLYGLWIGWLKQICVANKYFLNTIKNNCLCYSQSITTQDVLWKSWNFENFNNFTCYHTIF